MTAAMTIRPRKSRGLPRRSRPALRAALMPVLKALSAPLSLSALSLSPLALSALALSAFALSALALPARAAGLGDELRFAVRNSPQVRGALGDSRSISHEITGARAAMNPRFGAYAEPSYGHVRGAGRTGGGDVGVYALKPIYDGDRSRHEADRHIARLAASNERAELAQADVALRVSDAYIEALKQRELAQVTQDYVDQIDGLRGRVQEIVQLDRGRAYDLLQTESRLGNAQLTLSARRGNYQEQLASLSQLVGRRVDSLEQPEPPPLPGDSLEESIGMLDGHPSLMAARADVEAVRAQAQRAAAWNRPNVSVRARVNSPEYPFGQRQWFGGYDVGLVTDWNPFDGGVGEASARAAHELIARSEDALAQRRRELAAEVARAWTQVRMRAERAQSLDGLVAGAEKVRAAYWEQFQIGRRSMIDLLNAENEMYLARMSVITEKMDMLAARFHLVGTEALLLPWFNIEPVAPVPVPRESTPSEKIAANPDAGSADPQDPRSAQARANLDALTRPDPAVRMGVWR